MSTISASTTSTTAYKVTADTTGTLVFQTGASPTTAMSISSSQIISFTNPPTATGGGSVATNTAYGTSALAANTTGDTNTAVGYQALTSNQGGASNTAYGVQAMRYNTSGGANASYGRGSLYSNTSGSYNVACGQDALSANTTASYNTAVGYQSLYTSTGERNTALGAFSLNVNTTGQRNSATSYGALGSNTTGSYNTALGYESLAYNTTASYNTAVGYQAGYSTTTFSFNTFIGRAAGYSETANANTFVGDAAGYYVTSGAGNTIIGRYSGNQGGLDIRTASNYIVLSDGDGNPKAVSGAYPSGAGTYGAYTNAWTFGNGGTAATNDGVVFLNGTSYGAGYGPAIQGRLNGSPGWSCGSYSWVIGGSSNSFFACQNSTGGVYLNGSSATSWTAVSDETRKVIIEPITNAANKVATLRTVIGRLKTDEEDVRRPYLIAQDVQAVLPEAVSESEDKEGPVLGLSYTEVIPLLVAAIKELKAEIDVLKGQA